MSPVPKTRYVVADDGAHIAYQVLGEGPRDVLFIPGWITNLELAWENPVLAAYYERLASFSRLIILDKRGTGLSDPVPPDAPPTQERRMYDVGAVLDAVGSERVAIHGGSEGGPMSILLTATWPDRVTALVLIGAFARGPARSRLPLGLDPAGTGRSHPSRRGALGRGAPHGSPVAHPRFGP